MFIAGLFAFFSFQACIVLLLRPSTFFKNNVRPYFKLTLWSIRVVISPLKGLSPLKINMQKLLVNNTNQLQQESCFFDCITGSCRLINAIKALLFIITKIKKQHWKTMSKSRGNRFRFYFLRYFLPSRLKPGMTLLGRHSDAYKQKVTKRNLL